jgi:DNA modification methylase
MKISKNMINNNQQIDKQEGTNILINGDCLAVMKTFPDNWIGSIVTDPPA